MKHGSGSLDIGRFPEPACRVTRLWLSVTAYNLSNPWRRLALPRRIEPARDRLFEYKLDISGSVKRPMSTINAN